MSDNHAPPPLTPIIIVLRQDAIPSSGDAIDALTGLLSEHRVTDPNTDRLALFGIVTGTAPADQLDPIRELDPVESVEPDETMQLRGEENKNGDRQADS